MIYHSKKRPHLAFLLRRLKESDLYWLSGWTGRKNLRDEATRERIYSLFNRHYHHIWHSRLVRTWVMTINRRPAFCLTLLHLVTTKKKAPIDGSSCEYQLQLFASPMIRKNDHRLRLAWQAASIHVFLQLGLARVQVVVDNSATGENEALLMMGYQLVETASEASSDTNLYVCNREDFKPVL